MTVQLYTRNETELDFQYWSTSRPLSDDLRISISNADVLLVPQEGFRDYEGPVFPVLTHELFTIFASAFLPELSSSLRWMTPTTKNWLCMLTWSALQRS